MRQAYGRQAVGGKAAHGQRPPLYDEHGNNNQKGQRCGEARTGGGARDKRLGNADRQPPGKGARKGRKSPDQRCSQHRNNHQHQHGWHQTGQRNQQNARKPRHCAAKRPVHRGYPFRRNPESGGRSHILRNGRRLPPEIGALIESPQAGSHEHRDEAQDQPIQADRDTAGELHRTGGKVLIDEPQARSIPDDDDPFDDPKHTQGRYQPGKWRSMADSTHDAHVDQPPDQRGRRNPANHRKSDRQSQIVTQLHENRRAQQCHRPVSEIDNARTFIDQHDALRSQRINRAGPQAQKGKFKPSVHATLHSRSM